MRPSPLLRLAQTNPTQAAVATATSTAAHAYRPLIKFKGHHEHPPASTSNTLEPHPASPHASLPDSFAKYREKVTQHGPLAGRSSGAGAGGVRNGNAAGSPSTVSAQSKNTSTQGTASKSTASSASSQAPAVSDRSELPARFGRLAWREGEGELIESGGASLW